MSYKQRYGSIENKTWEGVIFRNQWTYLKYRLKLLLSAIAKCVVKS